MAEDKELRLAICLHKNTEIVQIYLEEYQDWLCLHNAEDYEDTEDVESFKKSGTLIHNSFYKSLNI